MARASQSGVIIHIFPSRGCNNISDISRIVKFADKKKKARRGNIWLHMGVMNLPKMAAHHVGIRPRVTYSQFYILSSLYGRL